MLAAPLSSGQVVDLKPFVPATITMLPVEKTAEPALRTDSVRSHLIAVDVYVELFGTEARLQQPATPKGRLLVDREEPSALVEIRRGFEGVKRIEVVTIDLLRKNRETDRQSIGRVDVVIDA